MSAVPMPRWSTLAVRLTPVLLVAAGLARPVSARATPFSTGDSLYAAGQPRAARDEWLRGLTSGADRYALLCRLARAESELAEDAHGEEQRQLAMAAVEHARRAVALAPDSAGGHAWLAVALGRQALREGPRTRLALAREIKAEADRAIALDPASGRAFHVRALWHRDLASLNLLERGIARTWGGIPPGASMEGAVRDLEQAARLEPAHVHHRLELARTYAMLKRRADARRELEQALALPPRGGARDRRYQEEARALLAKLPGNG